MTRNMWASAVVALMVCGAAGCSRSGSAAEAALDAGVRPAAAEESLPEVRVARPSREALETRVDMPGTLVPFDEATIGAEGAGPVVELRVEEGSRVRRGSVLVRLDDAKARLSVKQAEAMLAQARANFDKARSELARKTMLLEDRTIAEGTFETFKAQHDAAAAGVEAAETALALTQQRLEDLTVVAPFDGVVKEKRISLGEYVREGEDLVVLMRVDPLKLQFDVPEKYIGRLAPRQAVQAILTAVPGETVTATVETIFPAVAVQSRTIRVEARLPNPEYRLRPGFYASVRIPLVSPADGLVVPRGALIQREGTESVFVLEGDRVELVPVQSGAETGDRVEIVSGLTLDDQVVVSGVDALRPGDRVKVGG